MSNKTRPPRFHHRFTRDEINHIVARWPHVCARVIAEELGRTLGSIEGKARIMQLTRTPEQRAGIYKARIRNWKKKPAAATRAAVNAKQEVASA